jgi:hypothetical protein
MKAERSKKTRKSESSVRAMVVLVPEPFGPRDPGISPGAIVKLTRSWARTVSYCFVRLQA